MVLNFISHDNIFICAQTEKNVEIFYQNSAKLLIVPQTCLRFIFDKKTFEMQFCYMAYFFIEAEDLDKLNWSKVFLRFFFKCQTFRMRKSLESANF